MMAAPSASPDVCDLCTARVAIVRDLTARFNPPELQTLGLSPEAAREIKACRVCVETLEQTLR